METGVLAEELTCSVCLGLFQDPVALPCQHSFCAKCINDAWDHPKTPSGVSCPHCRQTFKPRPSLVKNHTLQNIVEKYNRHPPVAATSAQTVPVMCEYCIDNPTQAVKTCLKCETSFCSRHLQPHLTKQIYKDHCLIEPTADLTRRQCPSHRKALDFYCEQDEVCVCMSCTIVGNHKSHSLLSLEQAKDKLKEKLKNSVENIQTIQKEWSREQEDLKQSEIEVKRHSKEMKEKLLAAFSEWRKQLEDDEKLALKMIDEEENRALCQIKSSSDSLLKKMEEIQIIDKEAQGQVVEDPLFFIQDVKQLLSRYSQFAVFNQAAVKKQERNVEGVFGFCDSTFGSAPSFGSSQIEANRCSQLSVFKIVPANEQRNVPMIFSFGGSSSGSSQMEPNRCSQLSVFKIVPANEQRNVPMIFSFGGSSSGSSQMEPNRATEPKRVTLNVSAVRTVMQNKFGEYQKYQTTILQTLVCS
ncbi:E3 ubiquitin/ISG15 ligase TRIM25-like [Hypanus sabinus]|uniref:E3 ubiquitin/ISG15 ligase TRIM25-like n=1 Tax=Hypanus sabinus TaxID=79690 RepID=UPI0028C40049|nr:E3 ubiquitin/ISG15 ligase TRIM25-like [Hypanus sabinus]